MKGDTPDDQPTEWIPADVVCLGLTGSGADLGPWSLLRAASGDPGVDRKARRRRRLRADAGRDEGDAG